MARRRAGSSCPASTCSWSGADQRRGATRPPLAAGIASRPRSITAQATAADSPRRWPPPPRGLPSGRGPQRGLASSEDLMDRAPFIALVCGRGGLEEAAAERVVTATLTALAERLLS